MSNLRDDGYLETDDPVVAACFLGRRVITCGSSRDERQLVGVTKWNWIIRATQRKTIEADSDYPILIPARVVAEVVFNRHGMTTIKATTIAVNSDFTVSAITDWLRIHGGK